MQRGRPAGWEAAFPQWTGDGFEAGEPGVPPVHGTWERSVLVRAPGVTGGSRLCMGAICLIVTAPRAVGKGKQGDRAVTGEGLLVEMLVG